MVEALKVEKLREGGYLFPFKQSDKKEGEKMGETRVCFKIYGTNGKAAELDKRRLAPLDTDVLISWLAKEIDPNTGLNLRRCRYEIIERIERGEIEEHMSLTHIFENGRAHHFLPLTLTVKGEK